MSYRKGERWISEIDLCLIHEDVLNVLSEVDVKQEIGGSDHAPLCISLNASNMNFAYPILLERAKYLGLSYIRPPKSKTILPKTRTVKEIDLEKFMVHMLTHPPPILPECDIETALKTTFETVNEAAVTSVRSPVGDNVWEISNPRW